MMRLAGKRTLFWASHDGGDDVKTAQNRPIFEEVAEGPPGDVKMVN